MSFQLLTIDHVQLAAPISGEERARDFYHRVLCFEEIEKPRSLRSRRGV